MWDENWRPMMRVAAQLDGNGSGTAVQREARQNGFC
jgi:hypothetical protein